MSLIEETVPVNTLSLMDRDQMFAMLEAYYLGVNRVVFEHDLAEKEYVMLLREASTGRQIVGFSTLMRFLILLPAAEVIAVFSGDTIVEESCRRSFGFANGISRFFRQTLEEFAGRQVYYLLICKGWHTYRILPFLFRDFYPRFDAPILQEYRLIRDAFGQKKYPGLYQPESGRIIFAEETQRVRPGSPEALDSRREDPHTRFFAQANPRHDRGDELVCLAEVSERNFTPALKRLMNSRGASLCLFPRSV